MNLEIEALHPNATHIARRAAKAQLFPPSSKSQCTKGYGPKCVSTVPGQFLSRLPKHNLIFHPNVLKGNDFTWILPTIT